MLTQQILKDNEYLCAMCHGIFVDGWTDEEALEEYKENFAGCSDDKEIICDDCYEEIHPSNIPRTRSRMPK